MRNALFSNVDAVQYKYSDHDTVSQGQRSDLSFKTCFLTLPLLYKSTIAVQKVFLCSKQGVTAAQIRSCEEGKSRGRRAKDEELHV